MTVTTPRPAKHEKENSKGMKGTTAARLNRQQRFNSPFVSRLKRRDTLDGIETVLHKALLSRLLFEWAHLWFLL